MKHNGFHWVVKKIYSKKQEHLWYHFLISSKHWTVTKARNKWIQALVKNFFFPFLIWKKNMQRKSLTKITLGFPIAHMFTFLSSPPVTMTRPDVGPIARHVTLALWATNSSIKQQIIFTVYSILFCVKASILSHQF